MELLEPCRFKPGELVLRDGVPALELELLPLVAGFLPFGSVVEESAASAIRDLGIHSSYLEFHPK